MGFAVGVVTGVFFFRLDKQWVKYLTFTGGNTGFLAAFSLIADKFQIPSEDRLSLVNTYIGVALLTTIATILILLYFLKKETQEEDIKFRVLDILLGHQQAINKYYESRQRLIDNKLNIDELRLKRTELADFSNKVRSEKKALEAIKKEVEDLLRQCICISLPIEKSVPVDPALINLIPALTEDLINFSVQLAFLTEEFKSAKGKKDQATNLIAYLLAVCSFVAVYLFDSNSVRVHVRYLDPETDQYRKLVASVGGAQETGGLTPIPFDAGMISQARASRRAVIKSLNQDFHHEAKNDHIWEDYITMVFDDEKLCVGIKPILSLGVSVKNSETFKYRMRFICHCHIEQVIQRHLLSFNENVPIVETLKGGRAQWLKSA
jgi:NTP pyrophosphatase (non-canonical NTP hydrolase)